MSKLLLIIMRWQVYSLAMLIGKVVRFQRRGTTDELHPFTKNSETGLGLTTDSTALPRGIRQFSICVYYLKQNGQTAFAGYHQFSHPIVTGI